MPNIHVQLYRQYFPVIVYFNLIWSASKYQKASVLVNENNGNISTFTDKFAPWASFGKKEIASRKTHCFPRRDRRSRNVSIIFSPITFSHYNWNEKEVMRFSVSREDITCMLWTRSRALPYAAVGGCEGRGRHTARYAHPSRPALRNNFYPLTKYRSTIWGVDSLFNLSSTDKMRTKEVISGWPGSQGIWWFRGRMYI